MTDDRNLTAHTYHEEVAMKYAGKLRFIMNLWIIIIKADNIRIQKCKY
jgi:hypothetical protein